jgi:hypothetical protein
MIVVVHYTGRESLAEVERRVWANPAVRVLLLLPPEKAHDVYHCSVMLDKVAPQERWAVMAIEHNKADELEVWWRLATLERQVAELTRRFNTLDGSGD